MKNSNFLLIPIIGGLIKIWEKKKEDDFTSHPLLYFRLFVPIPVPIG